VHTGGSLGDNLNLLLNLLFIGLSWRASVLKQRRRKAHRLGTSSQNEARSTRRSVDPPMTRPALHVRKLC
jgi:hypothetical protein